VLEDLGGSMMRMTKTAVLALVILSFAVAAGAAGMKAPYDVVGEPFEGYLTMPSPEAPLVLLIHDWDGLTDYEIRRADMLAELGYAVFAADLYGAGVRPVKLEDKRRLTAELYSDREEMRKRLNGALMAAESMGADIGNAVAVGYCFGGTAVLELARSGADLKGFVTFHGGLSTPEGQDYSKTGGCVLVLHGTADESVGMEDFAELAIRLEQADIPHEMITYGGAPHAFTVFGSDRYRKDADDKSWKRFTEFLAETLDAEAGREPSGPEPSGRTLK
jgi:dienelactone hydrolase